MCAYLDLAGSTSVAASYFHPALRLNAVLTGNFGWLLDRVRQAVANELDREVDFDDRLARPGFHIWPPTAIHRQPNASLHFDLQYRHLPERYQPVDESEAMSFTLPIRVPARGAGLRYWDFTFADHLRDLRDGSAVSLSDQVRDMPVHYLNYTAGTLVIHRELILHQIGATPVVGPSDLRVTLQGHGIVEGTRLILYW